MTCHEYHNRLSSYMDGELSRWSRWKIETHLRHCKECAHMLRDLEDVDQSLSAALLGEAAPHYLTESVMFRLPAMPPTRRRPGGMLPWAAGLAVAGMQAMVLLGAYWSGFAHGSSSTPGRNTAAIGASSAFIGGNIPGRPFSNGGSNTPANEPRGAFTMPLFGRPAPELTSLESPAANAPAVRPIANLKSHRFNPDARLQGAH